MTVFSLGQVNALAILEKGNFLLVALMFLSDAVWMIVVIIVDFAMRIFRLVLSLERCFVTLGELS